MQKRDYTPATWQPKERDNAELGPYMRILNPRQQALVWYILETGTDNWTEAVTKVGYTGNYETLRVTASRLRRDPKIGLAIKEVAATRPNFDLPLALGTIRRIAADPTHKDAGKMALALAGMAGMSPIVRTEQHNTHLVISDPMVAVEAKLAMLPPEVAEALRTQLFPPEQRKVIDVTPTPAPELTDDELTALLRDL